MQELEHRRESSRRRRRSRSRSHSDIPESQNRNPSEMDTSSDLRRRLSYAEKQNLELMNQRNRDMSHYEKEIMKLQLELERGEALRRGLENDLSIVQKEANMQMYSAEDELCKVKTKLMELQALNDRHQQRAAETEQMYQNAQQQWIAEQQRFSKEVDEIRKIYHTELTVLIKEKAETEKAVQEMNAALQSVRRKLREMETEHVGCSERLRLQANQLEFKADQQEKLIKELEKATAKTRRLAESNEAARAAHLESKYTSEMMQLRIRELEEALNVKKGDNREALSVLENMKKNYTQSENAHEKEKRLLQRQLSVSIPQDRVVTEVVATAEPPPRQENAQTVFSQVPEEGPTKELSILLSLYQCMADGQVLVKKPEVTLEGLSGTEFCVLLHENVQGLIINFHKANEKIAYLEHICKQKTDTMRDLQKSHGEAYRKVTEQMATQEHCWQKEKKFLEMQCSNLLEEAQARAKECEDTAQKNRQKMSSLEKSYERLTQENINMKNTLANIQKERSSLLAACALLAGALFPLYIRLCAMSSQRDLLQDLVNHHELVNQKVGTIVRALPANVESNPDEARQRQRRAKGLVFVFRRDVIAVLTVNRLKILARSSCSLFVWSKGLRGSLGIQVCVGESRGRRNVSRFEEQGVDCVEALDWLTSSNLHAAIISSISELQDVLNKPDPNYWLSGHSLISAARNSFAKLMDSLDVMMEMVQANQCRRFSLLERDSLIQRLANGLQRANTQALEVGLHDRLTSMEYIAILQQQVFELSRKLHIAEAESCSLHLQLEELKLTFNEMKKEAEEAHRLQEQLNTLQQSLATQGNMHEELNAALQREQEARWLIQQHEQRLQELSFRLQVDTNADTDQNQDANVPVTNLSEAMEELRKRDRVLNHQKRLLKYMKQDRQRLQANAMGLDGALQAAMREKEFIVNHMSAVEAMLKGVRDYISASGAVEAMTLLPRLQLETVSEEALRIMPEVAAFQAVLTSFKDIYQLVASRIETLARGAQLPQVRVASQGTSAPREELLQTPLATQATSTRQQPLQVHFASQANIIPGEESLQHPFAPQATSTSGERPLPLRYVPQVISSPRREGLRIHFVPQATSLPGEDSLPVCFAAESITLSENESLPVDLAPQAISTARDGPLPHNITPHGLSTPVAPEGAARGAEPSHFTFMLESQPDRRDTSGGHALRVGPGASSDGMLYRTFIVPETKTPVRVTPSDSGAEPPKDIRLNVSPRKAFTVSAPNILAGLTPSSSGAEPPKDISLNVSPRKAFTVSAPNILPDLTPSSSGAEPPKDVTPNVTPPKAFTVSEASIPSSVPPSSSGVEPPKDVTLKVTPPKAFTVSEINMPSSVTPSWSGIGSLTDVFFDMTPYRTYSVSGANIPSGVTLSRTGTELRTNISSHAMANRTYPLTNIPSGGTQNRTVIGLPTNTPSRVAANRTSSVTNIPSSGTLCRTGTEFSNNTSFSFSPLEANTSSSPGSSNHNTLSSMRRNDGI